MISYISILLFTVPIVVLGTVMIIIIRLFLKNERENRRLNTIVEDRKIALPLKFQAYERLAMFLERITPENLLMRINKPGINARELQQRCIINIKKEFDHNLSQQVYVSVDTWLHIKSAKNKIEKLINEVGSELTPKDNGMKFSTELLSTYLKNPEDPVESAKRMLIKEANTMY
ncbi:MAG: hypothetical protein N4A72_02030 [Bacteroidales bacterium]|jgi:hypothetical protein|nr:hypothetical protein [Bacteroidales bacterium]